MELETSFIIKQVGTLFFEEWLKSFLANRGLKIFGGFYAEEEYIQ